MGTVHLRLSTKRTTVCNGFTLVQLLTTMAILAVLSTILIAVIGSVRESARGAVCAANMRQIAQALLLYANENNGLGPAGRNDQQHEAAGGAPGTTGLASTYFYSLWPYLYGPWNETHHSTRNTVTLNSEKQNIFHCPTRYTLYPEAALAPDEMFVSGKKSTFAWWDRYAYAINAMAAIGATADERAREPVRIADMRSPSQTVAIVEDYNWYVTFTKYYDRYGVIPHGAKANFAFYDGHVQSLSLAQIPTRAEAQQTVFWSGDNVD